MAKIENMWDNFSMDKYAPRLSKSMRKRSNSLSRLSDASFKSKSVDLDSWKHRITIPKPFSMTVRESFKTPTKSQAMMEMQLRKEEEERKENEECQKKFKAKPVPAHIYMPLYDEIMEQQEARRRYNHQHSEEFIKAVQKPFKLSTREQEKKEKVKRQSQFHKVDNAAKKEFKAKPFPEHLFRDNVNDRMQEEEYYRQIRLRMRSEELLRTSSLPESMAIRGKDYTNGKSRQKIYAERAKKAGLTSEHKFQPRINDDMPDFEERHRHFLRDLGQSRAKREATICKPFNLRTSRIPSTKHKIYEDIARDEQMLRENRWPFQSTRARIRTPDETNNFTGISKALSTSLDSLPTKMTNSAQLRTSANKSRMQQHIDAELAELEMERRRRLKAKQLQRTITERALTNDQTSNMEAARQEKLREYRSATRSRQSEYQQNLNEMQERVDQRPLLFEQTVQENARKKAERKYNETINRVGLSQGFIDSRSSGASHTSPSARSSARSSPRSMTRSKSYGTGKYSDNFEADHTEADGSEIEEMDEEELE